MKSNVGFFIKRDVASMLVLDDKVNKIYCFVLLILKVNFGLNYFILYLSLSQINAVRT